MSDSLVDLLDRIVGTGVAATGDVTISLADVELISLRLQLLLDSIGTDDAPPLSFPSRRRARPTRTVKLEGDEDSLQRGLAQLVLVLVELLGELLERQALRRMAAGTLQDDEVRKLGNAFAALHRRLDELHEELLAAPREGTRRPLSEPPLPAVR